MTSSFEYASNPREYAETVLRDSQAALQAAVEAIDPENPSADPLEVFPAPGEVRNEDTGMELTEEQGLALRAAAAQLGFERLTDALPSDLGLGNGHFIIEGGQPHKIVAEAGMVMSDAAANPKTLIFSASPYRKISSEAEQASCMNQFDEVFETEYDVARKAAQSLPGFKPYPVEQKLPIGYDIDKDFELVIEGTGQFVLIGHVGSARVMLMRIDREEYTDGQGESKYRKQPGAADVMRIVDAAMKAGDDEEYDMSPIGFVTSATYQPSRSVDAAKTGLTTGRVIGVSTYGTTRLAEVNGADMPLPRRFEQLPGEMHKLALEVAKLEEALRPDSSVFELELNFEPLGEDALARIARIETILLAVIPLARKNLATGASSHQGFEDVLNAFRADSDKRDLYEGL